MLANQLARNDVLGPVRVLVLVHVDMPKPPPIARTDIVMLTEHPRRQDQQIVKIEAVTLLEGGVVPVPQGAAGLVFLGRGGVARDFQVLFVEAEPLQRFPRGYAGIARGQVLHEAFHQGELVAIIDHRELSRAPHRLDLTAKNIKAKRMERSQPRPDPAHPKPLGQPDPHLFGRTIGKGHCQQMARIHAALIHEPGEPLDNDPGFPGARAGKHQSRSLRMPDRLKLPVVKGCHFVCHCTIRSLLISAISLIYRENGHINRDII